VASAFGDALGGVFSVVAQNAVLNISVPPGSRLTSVHHDKKSHQVGESCKVNLGDFYAEESRDVLFEVTLAPGSNADNSNVSVPHAYVGLSYLDTIGIKLVDAESVSACISRPNSTVLSPPNPHVVVQWLRVQATAGMAEADRLSRQGNLEAARAKITSLLSQLRDESAGAGIESDPLIVQLISDLNEVMSGLRDTRTYETYGCYVSSAKHQTHTYQRCAEADVSSMNVYRSSAKSRMARKLKK